MIDSGVGGLSVYRALRRLAPSEDVLYFADTLYFPYGPRPAPEVRKRAFQATRRLLDGDAKLIIVACNTASAAGLEELRQAFSSVPFVGMVPGLKPAIGATKASSVAVLATPGTFEGGLYEAVRREFGRGTRVTAVPGDGLAELVEAGQARSDEARAALREALAPAAEAGADTLVLGCTHYAFLEPLIRELHPELTIIDTSEPVARRAVAVLAERGLTRDDAAHQGRLDFVVTANKGAFLATVDTFSTLSGKVTSG
jgi:glutamate racemase